VKTHPAYLRIMLGLLALVLVVSFLLSRPQNTGQDLWLPSSFNPSPRGHKALFVTLQDLHWPVARWHKPYTELSGTGQCLIITRAASQTHGTFSPREINLLLQWVGAGNHLILAGNFAGWPDTLPLLQRTGFLIPAAMEKSLLSPAVRLFIPPPPVLDLQPGPGWPVPPPASPLQITAENSLPPPPASARILWMFQGEAYAAEISHLRGTITFLSSTSFVDNRNLADESNLRFLLELLRPHDRLPEIIWFEEAHHGYRLDGNAAALLRQPGLRIALGQAALGLLVFLSAQMIRFGPVRSLPQDSQRSSVEFINAMASLYRRSDRREEFAGELFAQTHAAILRRLNLPGRASHDLIAERLKASHPHLPSWKKLAQRFTPTQSYVSPLPPAGWLKVSRELITIKNEML
jgi:Domain of unknown function (DUF4350)